MAMRTLIVLVFLVSGCGVKPVTPPVPPALGVVGASKLAVVTSDRKSEGEIQLIDLVSSQVEKAVQSIHSDAYGRAFSTSDAIYVINRMGKDNLQPVAKDLSKKFPEESTGRGSNPHDVAVVGKFAYVSLYDGIGVIKFALPDRAGGKLAARGTIDLRRESLLPRFPQLKDSADDDGKPEAGWMTTVGDKLLVQVQYLKNWTPAGSSYLAVIDTATDSVVSMLPLAQSNPVVDFKTFDGKLYVGETGHVAVGSKLDGAIERWNPATLKSEGIVIDEKALGGEILDFEILASDRALAIVYQVPSSTALISFDPSKGVRRKTLVDPKNFSLKSLLWDEARGLVYLADLDKAKPGIRIFDAATLEEKGQFRFSTRLMPEQMFFVR